MFASFLNEFEEFITTRTLHPKDVFFDDTPVLLHGSDMFYLESLMKMFMRRRFATIRTTVKKSFNDIEFESNEEFVVFDMKAIIGTRFSEFNEYIKFLSQNRVIFDIKKYIIIKNIHCTSKTQQLCFVHNLSALMRSYSVIVTSLNLNTITTHIKSHFAYIKCYPDMGNLLVEYAKYTDPASDTKEIVQTCLRNDKDLLTSLMAIHTKTSSLVVEQDVQKLLCSIKKTKNVGLYLTKVRVLVHKVMVYNVPHQRMLRTIWQCLYTKYKKQPSIYEKILTDICELDANILRASKALYHYEKFFLSVFRLVNQV